MDVDFEQKNAVGGLDRLVTNVALAAIAVFPTLAIALIKPWKLVPLIQGDEPDGHKNMILSPGAFLPLGLTVVLLLAAAVTTSETVASNGGAIGPALAVSVATAAGEGDIWKTISLIAPIYAIAIVIALSSQILRPLIGDWWTMRIAVRAAFYQVGVTICWILLSSAAIDAYRVNSGNQEMGFLLYSLNSIPIFGISLWLYFWFFFRKGETRWWLALGLAIVLVALIIGLVSGTSWLFGQI
ncbi:MAG: hypothetical protein NXH72_07790 [Hyphomonadaceae bacterium]|nr:hypothetical protein [Hyphomonadaceae bacterium]